MLPRSRLESVSSSISPITALKHTNTLNTKTTNKKGTFDFSKLTINLKLYRIFLNTTCISVTLLLLTSPRGSGLAVKGKGHSHVVSPDNVKAQHHLLHVLRVAEYSLVDLVQNQVNCLVEALQRALQNTRRFRHVSSD